MRLKVVKKTSMGLALMGISSLGICASLENKTISQMQPDHPSADCYFFTLAGVAEADPVRPGNNWFAVDRTAHPGAKDLYATLLAARLTGTPITVVTTGALACGYAGVMYVVL